jgi:hypothetical protein
MKQYGVSFRVFLVTAPRPAGEEDTRTTKMVSFLLFFFLSRLHTKEMAKLSDKILGEHDPFTVNSRQSTSVLRATHGSSE